MKQDSIKKLQDSLDYLTDQYDFLISEHKFREAFDVIKNIDAVTRQLNYLGVPTIQD